MALRRPLVIGAGGLPAELPPGDTLFMPGETGLIQGLTMQWVGAAALTVTTGSAHIESAGTVLAATSAIAKTGLTLTASTWYHVYLYSNAGTPDIEIVTTAPAAAYAGTARSKTGDTSRRYIGSVRTLASNAIARFRHSGDRIGYFENTTAAPFRVLAAGFANPYTAVSCAAVIPITSGIGVVYALNIHATAPFQISGDGTLQLTSINPKGAVSFHFPLNSSQQFFYQGDGVNVACYADVHGYTFER